MRKSSVISGLLALLATSLLSTPGSANERHFGYSYESATLPEGAREIEVWSTYRTGRSRFYNQFDHRLEFEVGLTNRLQTSLYLNFGGGAEDSVTGERIKRFEYQGVSNEWKLRVLDAVADPVGLAFYAELGLAPEAFEVELKIILDKRIGNLLLVSNLVFAPEWERAPAGKESEVEFEFAGTLGASYFLRPSVALGVEGRVEGKATDEEAAGVGAYVGPVITWASKDVWTTFTFQRQLPALKKEASGARFLEAGHELYQARLLFSFHI